MTNGRSYERLLENTMTRAKKHSWTEVTSDRPMDKIERRRIIGEQMMISRVHLSKGFVVPSHQHINEQFAVVLSGKMKFGLGKEGTADHEEMIVGAGEVLWLPSRLPHSAEALEDTIILDLFSPPSEKTGVDR